MFKTASGRDIYCEEEYYYSRLIFLKQKIET